MNTTTRDDAYDALETRSTDAREAALMAALDRLLQTRDVDAFNARRPGAARRRSAARTWSCCSR